jgi:uncharacterized protein YecE (DUF72 family)
MAHFFKKTLAMHTGIHIGTSGWSYKHWKNLYYPKDVKSADWLPFYAQTFSTTEINGSFYRLPTRETVIKWTQQVPPGFIFCPKMSRYLTHMKKLRDPEEPLERFFGIFEPMKDRMGPVLLQLPPMLPFRYDLAEAFFYQLGTKYKDYDFVLEVRHNTWLHDDALTLMTKFNIGFVISESDNAFPYLEMITARDIYVRFHGPGALYASSYPDDTLSLFAQKFRTWVGEGHTVWAYFNNDIHGFAIENAKRMMELLGRGV